MSRGAVVRAINSEDRTVDVVWSTGAETRQYDWWRDERFIEKLSMKPEHVRLGRLNNGAPLLDTHSRYSLSMQIGVVQRGSASVDGTEGTATLRFSKRATVDDIWGDVEDEIIRNTSIGYRVYKYLEEVTEGELPVRTAVDWEPFEISLVPVPADAGAQLRSDDTDDTYTCEIERAATRAIGESMPAKIAKPAALASETMQSETVLERDVLDPGGPSSVVVEPTAAESAERSARDEGIETERQRTQAITVGVRAGRLPAAFADALIADGVSLVEAQQRILAEIGKRDLPANGPRPTSGVSVQMGDDPMVHVRAGIENAILHRVSPNLFKLEDVGRNYRGLSLLDTAGVFLRAMGVRTTGLSKMEIAGLALGLNVRAGYHTTSDFAILLGDVSGKTLRKAYEEAPQTFSGIARRITFTDFKPQKRVQLGDAPKLLLVDEHGEYTRGTIGEGREQFQLATYGRIFAITRKTLVNDDTDAFGRVPQLFGRSARSLESDLIWSQILANPVMADGLTLFHSSHANLSGTSDAISITSIGAGRAAMRKQTGLDGTTLLNVNPITLIVSPSKETLADQFVSTNLAASSSSAVNPFAGRLAVISEPRLEVGIGSIAGSANAWYLAGDPNQADIIEYGSLEGDEGPAIETRIGFDVDGMEVKCRHDFAAKAVDHRGLWKNPGA